LIQRIFILAALSLLPARADTIAVLPFWNADSSAAASNLDWIGESVSEMLRETLSERGILGFERDEIEDSLHRLRLRDRVPLSQASVMKIGDDLDAELVLFGSFTAAAGAPGSGTAGSLKLTARILDRRHLHFSPEFLETGALEDLTTIEAHLAWHVLSVLSPKSAPPESDFKILRPSVRLDAEESYVRGLLARDPAQKEKFFLQANRLDPRLAHAAYELGQIHFARKDYRQAADWLAKVPVEDPHYRAARFLLGLAQFDSGDFQSAQQSFQTIAETVPIPAVLNNLGAAESRMNRASAIDDFRKAVADDERDPVYQFNLGYALWKKGDFTEAAAHFRAVLDHSADDSMATLLLGRSLKKQGFHAAVDARLASLERLKTDYPERAYWQLKSMLDSKR